MDLPTAEPEGRTMRRWPALTVIAAGVLQSACGGPRDAHAELRALIDDAETAAEARQTGFFRNLISEDYVDRRGQRRDDVINLLRGYFLINATVEVVNRIETIELLGDDAATVALQTAVIGRGQGRSVLAVDGELFRIELELVKEGSEWRIIGAEWDRLLR
jgi:hypothetical protein